MVKFISGCVIFLVVYSSCSLSEVASNRTITKVLVYQNRALIAYEPFYENNLDCGQNEEAGLLNINFTFFLSCPNIGTIWLWRNIVYPYTYVDCVLCTKIFVNVCLFLYMSSFYP